MPDIADATDNLNEFSVSELSAALKRTVEDRFGHVRLRAEISGFKRAASGHCYLSLKDDRAVIDGVMWKGVAAGLRFLPEDGMEVICTGKVTTYPARSKYQIVIDHMAPAGIGALLAQLEERRKKLAAEGLFAPERKRPLPYLPDVIGIVTSPTGAVIRDILHRLDDRFPRQVLLWPVLVQGEQAADQIAAAITGFNNLPQDGAIPRPDLLIVARGGGSIEDLWAFNEEAVVRAAAGSEIPLISAVGHETDTTLIDYAADQRAPTPTAAAEIAVPVRRDLQTQLLDLDRRRLGALGRNLDERRARLVSAARGLPRLGEILGLPRQRLDAAGERLPRALMVNIRHGDARLSRLVPRIRPETIRERMLLRRRDVDEWSRRLAQAQSRRLVTERQNLSALGKLLGSLSYRGVLARGFAVIRDADNQPLHRAAEAQPAMPVSIEFQDGRRTAVIEPGKTAIGSGMQKTSAKPRTAQKKNPQGELF
ncbi:MAG TPA: exodeoxyribonuclease VII large subunit [Alphaproteobacteria bacterium]|nr:exodeoxyribonuclease VII large subunit [Alphaproteobacteria bacterium]HBF98336.1 exodeoxyribonuclease VII large subunit [Alphaproteobacteria bacterium]